MNLGMKAIAVLMLVVLFIPCVVSAGEAPSAQVNNNQSGDAEDNPGPISEYQDVRGRTAYGGTLFWYQYFILVRYFAHWGLVM